MTKDTPPMQGIAWEPKTEGIELTFNLSNKKVELPMPDVRELAADMEEANMLSRGYEKDECEIQEVIPLDILFVAGRTFTVSSTLAEPGEKWVLQSLMGDEIIMHQSELITVYRKIQ